MRFCRWMFSLILILNLRRRSTIHWSWLRNQRERRPNANVISVRNVLRAKKLVIRLYYRLSEQCRKVALRKFTTIPISMTRESKAKVERIIAIYLVCAYSVAWTAATARDSIKCATHSFFSSLSFIQLRCLDIAKNWFFHMKYIQCEKLSTVLHFFSVFFLLESFSQNWCWFWQRKLHGKKVGEWLGNIFQSKFWRSKFICSRIFWLVIESRASRYFFYFIR